MARINPETKQKMLDFIKAGKSLNYISKELILPKTTIYYHYEKIIGKKIQQPNFAISQSEVEGEIIGAFAADGGSVIKKGLFQITFYLGGNETDYCKKLTDLLTNYFNKKPYVYTSKKKSLISIRYRSKLIYYFIRHYLTWQGKKVYSIELQKIDFNKDFVKGFIRGYFDCDGYSYPNNRKIVLMGVSGKMLTQIHNIMTKLGFSPYLYVYREKRKNMHDLYNVILKGPEAQRFIQFINPNNPKRIKDGAAVI